MDVVIPRQAPHKSSPGLRKKASQKKYAAEFTSRAAVFQSAIETLQREIRLSHRDCILQRLRAPRLELELSPAGLSRSFVHTPQGVQHRPERRCIFS